MKMFILSQDFNFFDLPSEAVAHSLETSSIIGLIHGLLWFSEKGVPTFRPHQLHNY